ncbi:HNH endonuclease [Rhodococcus sp. NPDC056506]|uniref:HNH endonuclease n=1 Tax=Rhodococcus sp. NPDC056506 TaxID=3345844 RepID=UPI00366DF0AA
MATATGTTVPASNGRIEVKSVEGEHYLQSLLETDVRIDVTHPTSGTAYEPGEDLRARSKRTINIRRGQGKFRDSRIDSYHAKCAVTGSPALAVLEAAHINRYFGDHSHHATNGLLLRADTLTLFNLLRITVDESRLLRVDPKLTGTDYEPLDGTPLRLPANRAHHPNVDALRRHRESCTWMSKSSATA